MSDRITARFVKGGVMLVALGPVPALMGALDLVAAPALAIATHLTMMVSGVLFMSLGSMWPRVRLSEGRQNASFWLLVVGVVLAVTTGLFAALLGVGGNAVIALTGDGVARPGSDLLVRISLGVAGLSAIAGLGLVLKGAGGLGRDAEAVEAEVQPASASEQIAERLLRIGLLLSVFGISSGVLTGLTALPGLPAPTHAAVMILAGLFLSLGLVWPRVGLEDSRQIQVLRLLSVAAVLTIVSGALARLLGVLEVGAETLSVSPVGLLGGQGPELIVKLSAFLAVLSLAAGVVIVFLGLPKVAPRAEGALKLKIGDHTADRLIRFGVLLMVLAAASALLSSLTQVPRIAVGTWATVLIIGPILVCFGLVWPQVHMTEGRQRATFVLLSWGAVGLLGAGMLAALLGIGGETLAVSAPEAVGSPGGEALARILIDLPALLIVVGMLSVWLGVREPARASGVSRALRFALYASIVVVLEAAFYHAAATRGAGGQYPLQLLDYGYGEADSITWIWDDDERTTAQNWTPDDWQWFYHASQGGALESPIPYDWMLALEQPTIPLWPRSPVPLLMDQDYLVRFGFLQNSGTSFEPAGLSLELHEDVEPFSRLADYAENNPDLLPVGFARTDNWPDRESGETLSVLGFTCSACHTGQVDYVTPEGDLVQLRIEGGPANIDLGKFRVAIGLSLFFTDLIPGRFDRFAERLGAVTRAERAELRDALEALLERAGNTRDLQESRGIYPTEEGYARLDAIGRAANFQFGSALGIEENVQVADAPVNFPHIWDAPWFDWVQYNASFKQPMMRNVSEAVGVFASVNMQGAGSGGPIEDDPLLFSSTVDIISLYEMESLIAGRRPFGGLESPIWPAEILGRLEEERVARGEGLYGEYCMGCHLPVGDSLAADWDATPVDDHENRYLALRISDLWTIGTDPLAATNFGERRVDLGELGVRMGIGRRPTYGEALPRLVDCVMEKRYSAYGIPDSTVTRADAQDHPCAGNNSTLQDELEGYRAREIQGPLGYRARPLNGIWATPPFLHNASVPTMYQLLGSQDERPDRFWLGSRRFDPVHIGFDHGPTPGGFEFDTTVPGNSNEGHLFEGDPDTWKRQGRKGVVGPSLNQEQRLDIIEYLKSLRPLPVRVGG